jgi:hypothetical protein
MKYLTKAEAKAQGMKPFSSRLSYPHEKHILVGMIADMERVNREYAVVKEGTSYVSLYAKQRKL